MIEGAPMLRNRTTVYTGRLFGSEEGFNVGIDGTWGKDEEGKF